ncbi:MAG: FAD-binding oxidoreductase [Acidobacteriota bacterium]|nr:FAD-binding oxidoreductase [Acidobacteriota bacterium]
MSTSAALTLEQGMAHLASIVGQEHVRLHGDTIVASPADTQQIAEILRFADANRLAVMPIGSGSKQSWGNPVEPDVQLNMTRLDALHEHAWQDMTCTVQAGCSWAAMQAELAQHGQMVALDPLWPERATVGGIVASNDSGALRLKFGGLRDLIIGMTIVLADGTIAKTGGKVVKNVAGYDLHKLMTGSFGTLGVIAEVNFRLHPLEDHTRTWTAVAPDAAIFAAPLRALMDSQMTPSSVQLRTSKQACALDIRIAAQPECLDEYAARIQSIFGQIAIAESSEAVWQARQQLFDKNDAVVLKVSVLPSELCSISAELQQWAAAEALDIATVGQATGLMTVALHGAPDAEIALIERLRARLTDSGGSVVALQIPDSLRGRIDVWNCHSNALPLMREIKRRFDPNRILNPGRFVGNI